MPPKIIRIFPPIGHFIKTLNIPRYFLMTEIQQKKFKDIKHLLPEESWARQRNELNDGEFDDENVLHVTGDYRVARLELDTDAFLILVGGNLTVDSYIHNENTDGATGLVVLGNLCAQNVVVGGQELYVGGNLDVTELFWGDYSHGDLTVKGDAKVTLFIDTDEYHTNIGGKKNITLPIGSLSTTGCWLDPDTELLLTVVQPDCVMEEDGEPSLWREKMLEYLQAGTSIIQQKGVEDAAKVPETPTIFTDNAISTDNLQRLTQPSLMPGTPLTEHVYTYECWIGDRFFRAVVEYDPASKQPVYHAVRLQEAESRAVLIETAIQPPKGGLLGKLTGKRGAVNWSLGMRTQDMAAAAGWAPYQLGRSPARFTELLQLGWATTLRAVSNFEYARNLITPDELSEVLALPVAEPYDDYYSDEKNGCWVHRNRYCAFRQEGAVYKGKPMPALLKVAWDYSDFSGERRTAAFTYEIRRNLDGSESVLLGYRADEDDNGSGEDISYTDPSKAREAFWEFRAVTRRLRQLNTELLSGEPPYDAPDFAWEYWQKKGYVGSQADAPDPDGDTQLLDFADKLHLDENTKSVIKKLLSQSADEIDAETDALIDAQPNLDIPFMWQGHRFTRISARQARELLTAHPYEDTNLWDHRWGAIFAEDSWLLAEGDVTMDTLQLDAREAEDDSTEIAGIIFRGNLTLKQYLDGSNIDYCASLFVLGDLTTPLACFGNNNHFVRGGLHAGVLTGEYNDGYLIVMGDVNSRVIRTDDFPVIVHGSLTVDVVVGDQLYLNEVQVEPDTSDLKAVFVDAVLFDDGEEPAINYDVLFQYAKQGKAIRMK